MIRIVISFKFTCDFEHKNISIKIGFKSKQISISKVKRKNQNVIRTDVRKVEEGGR